MGKLTTKSKDLSIKLFRNYQDAIDKAQVLLDDLNLDGELSDRIFMDNDKFGKYCKININFITFKLEVRLSLFSDTHRMCADRTIDNLDDNVHKVYTLEELKDKIKQINTMI